MFWGVNEEWMFWASLLALSSEIRPPSLEPMFYRLSGSFIQRKIGEACRFALLSRVVFPTLPP